MSKVIKQRIVGVIFILSLVMIVVPLLWDIPSSQEDSLLVLEKPKAPVVVESPDIKEIHYVFSDLSTPTPPGTEPNAGFGEEIFLAAVVPADFTELEWWTSLPAEGAAERDSPATQPSLGVAPALAELDIAPTPDLPAVILPQDTKTEIPPVATTKAAVASTPTFTPGSHDALWTIQLGAFSNEKNAGVLIQRLAKQGFEAYIDKTSADSLIRVYVSRGVSREVAQDVLKRLDQKMGLKGIVVRFSQT